MSRQSIDEASEPRVIDGRYELQAQLGAGGMAVVYLAHDRLRHRSIALKRLLGSSEPTKQRRNHELFEREFHMLSQLAHPRIVQVYDFGVVEDGAYYTMELLEGRDLQSLAPVRWRQMCALARDVCSALSLIHSRRFVHRDVSPRNVHCSPNGTAKLIDFGVVEEMGATKLLVGTPPCCAPESVSLQQLDARTDLFALGATLFFALVGRHAYPARRFSDLAEVWRRGVARPRDLISEVPKALDALVMDMLQLDPNARPGSAAEVIERLMAIDGTLATEELMVASAYLATPPLVGRELELARVQRRIQRVPGDRSRSVILEGAPGVGRTRFLDACLLNATLLGQVVVRCDADDARSGDYGVTRAIARQLFERVPDAALAAAAPFLETLRGILPDSVQLPDPANAAAVTRVQLQQALRAWISALSHSEPLVLAVDDFHRIDEPSASLLALLEAGAERHHLCMLLTVEAGETLWTAPSARKLLASATTIKLGELSPAQAEQLLRSLFGSVPNLAVLTARAQALCEGNPRDLLQFARHLVDRGALRYGAGTWTLPAEIDESDLPASMADALRVRVETSSQLARRLAGALALCADQGFSLEDCAQLCEEPRHRAVLAAWDELNQQEIARRVNDRLTLTHGSWVPIVRSQLTAEDERALQTALAQWFEQRADEVRAAQHWFRAGHADHALDLMVAHSKLSQEKTALGPDIFAAYLRTLPPSWFEIFDEAIRMCDVLGRPPRHKFELLSRLSGILPMLNVFAPKHTMTLFAMLKHDSGLEDWDALSDEADPKQRLMKALERARARYEQTPERERVSDPLSAIQHLARAVVGAGGAVVMSLDLAHLRSWPQLEPLAALSPAIQAAVRLIDGIDARCAGRNLRARRLYLELLALVTRPDRAGLAASHAGYIALGVMNGLGVLDAVLGLDSCLAWADKIAVNTSYEVNAVLIRMLHHVFNGDFSAADACKREAERVRIQNIGRPMYEGQHLIGEVQAYVMAGDITRVRQTRDEIAPFAERHEPWRVVLDYANAAYTRLVGDPARGLQLIELCLSRTLPGMHQLWPAAACSHVMCLLALDRAEQAAQLAEHYVTIAERELEFVPERLGLTRAFARASRGDADGAALADAIITRMESSGFGRLPLGYAYELRARIALCSRDQSGFERAAARCRDLLSAHDNAALVAKCERLLQDGARIFAGPQAPPIAQPELRSSDGSSQVEFMLGRCKDDPERALLALSILASQGRISSAYLFTFGEDGPIVAAQLGETPFPNAWRASVAAYLDACSDNTAVTVTQTDADDDDRVWIDERGTQYQPVLLAHDDRGTRSITGLALLAKRPEDAGRWPFDIASAISRFYAASGARTRSTKG
jgi:serine/threonine-protein kinase